MVKCSSVKVMHRGNLNHLKNRLLLFTVLIYGDISKDQHLCGVVRTPTVVFPVCSKMLDDVEVRGLCRPFIILQCSSWCADKQTF